ncbi:MAG: aspartate--ammonia ligase [Oscillospiraceae bacterium]|nr:aspartate--ammonia ligase [Oscillospiraceae bacterium]
MSKSYIPAGYRSNLNVFETQVAIGEIKRIFIANLSAALNLKRVSAPLFVDPKTGLNDDLSGVERAVTFDIKETGNIVAVVQSLAKWKRMALHNYKFSDGVGLYADMNAIRRDEELDNTHSVYVDQWDWEKIILRENRNIEYLYDTINSIVGAMCDTLDEIKAQFPQITTELARNVHFITAQELEDKYPNLSGKEREDAIAKEYKTVFISQIGGVLKSGEKHDGRAPDYDDWSLNGDIIFWNPILGRALELSSMGIRVDAAAMDSQLSIANCDARRELPFHKMVLSDDLPLTMGGGIGQSRLCMLFLGKAHVGEVQSSVWDDKTIKICDDAGVVLL